MKSSLVILVLLPYGISCSFAGFGIFGLASLYAGYRYTACIFGSCCRDSWSLEDFKELQEDFRRQLHGQHLAEEALLRQLKSHFLDSNPKKALVLSLHGTTGSGKNFVTSIAIKRLLLSGEKSSFFKLWTAKHHFSDENLLDQYKMEVQKTIREIVQNCPRSIFVFDEANELPVGLLDVLKPLMDEYIELDGVNYRKTTFFFLSNTGSTKINQVTINSKKSRLELSLNDYKHLIEVGAFNEKGGFLNSKLIEKNLIDSYIPFLPMGRDQIKLCIRDFLRSKKCPIEQDFIEKIANLINYEPSGHNHFASYGCRGVDSLVKQEMDHNCMYTQRTEL